MFHNDTSKALFVPTSLPKASMKSQRFPKASANDNEKSRAGIALGVRLGVATSPGFVITRVSQRPSCHSTLSNPIGFLEEREF